MTIKLYRHYYHKNIYLARNWHICGGSSTTEFYYATEDIIKAIADANKKGFESWLHSFIGDDLKTKLKVKITRSKEIEIDGYKGVCQKVCEFPVSEFELVELVEKE